MKKRATLILTMILFSTIIGLNTGHAARYAKCASKPDRVFCCNGTYWQDLALGICSSANSSSNCDGHAEVINLSSDETNHNFETSSLQGPAIMNWCSNYNKSEWCYQDGNTIQQGQWQGSPACNQ